MALVAIDFFFRRMYDDIEEFYKNYYMPEIFDTTESLHLALFNDNYEKERFSGLKDQDLRKEKHKFLNEIQDSVNRLRED